MNIGRGIEVRDIESRVLKFAWEQNPDLALDAGYLPPRLWEDLAVDRKQRACEEAESLKDIIVRTNLSLVERLAAQYHVTSAYFWASTPAVCMLNHMTGPVARLSWAGSSWPLAADPSCDLYIERLEQFTSYCKALVRCIREEPETLEYASRAVLSAFMAQVDAFIDAEQAGAGAVFLPLRNARIRGHQCKTPRPDLLADILTSVLALRQAAESAVKSAQSSSPLLHTREGADRYSAAIYCGTSAPMTPDDIERLGRDILSRSMRRFRKLLKGGGVAMECPQTGEQLLEEFRTAYARLTGALPSISPVQPVMRCQIVPMPEAHAVAGPPAYYGPSSFRNAREGSLYVNAAAPIKTRSWEILPLTMHEGMPGHHLQLGTLDENEGLSDLVRLLSVNAFTEGWAVYAETLASAMDLEISPAEEFGLLAYQRWRAARLVVDVGLHVRGWSIAKATRFMSGQTAQDVGLARREVVRYLAWPGQALGYSVGAHVISGWVKGRREAGVSLRETHKELLGLGSVTLSGLMPSSGDYGGLL